MCPRKRSVATRGSKKAGATEEVATRGSKKASRRDRTRRDSGAYSHAVVVFAVLMREAKGSNDPRREVKGDAMI